VAHREFSSPPSLRRRGVYICDDPRVSDGPPDLEPEPEPGDVDDEWEEPEDLFDFPRSGRRGER